MVRLMSKTILKFPCKNSSTWTGLKDNIVSINNILSFSSLSLVQFAITWLTHMKETTVRTSASMVDVTRTSPTTSLLKWEVNV